MTKCRDAMEDLNIYDVENYTFGGNPEKAGTGAFPTDQQHVKDVEMEFKKSGNSVITAQTILLAHDHKHACILLLRTPTGFRYVINHAGNQLFRPELSYAGAEDEMHPNICQFLKGFNDQISWDIGPVCATYYRPNFDECLVQCILFYTCLVSILPSSCQQTEGNNQTGCHSPS